MAIPNKFKIVDTWEGIYELIEYVKATRICSLDIETDGLDMFLPDKHINTISISFQIGSSYIIPLYHFESPFSNKEALKILHLLNHEIFSNTKIVKVAWNIKFEAKWLMKYGCELHGRCYDGMVAKYYLDENTPMGLKENVAELIPEFAGYDDATKTLVKKYGWSKVPLAELAPYNGLDTDLTLRLMHYYHDRLIDCGFYQLFRNLRMMASKTLTESEFHGCRISKPYLDAQVKKYEKLLTDKWAQMYNHPRIKRYRLKKKKSVKKNLIKDIRKEIAQLRETNPKNMETLIKNREAKIMKYSDGIFSDKIAKSMELNFNSAQQMADLFYESEYGFEFPILGKTESGAPSTSEETLLKLKSRDKTGFITDLLELRGLEKFNSTFIQGIVPLLDQDDYVHPSYKIAHTVTHRLSCTSPNVQQTPRMLTNPDARPMYEPPEGLLHFSADYSQAELRVVAELANDKAMIDIFKRGYNIHNATACLANGRLDDYDEIYAIMKDDSHPDNEFWLRQKKAAKTVNFGILYGQGDEKLAEGMGTSVEEAAEFKAKWFDAYPGVVRWIKKQQRFAKKEGFVWNIWGYKRRLPDIWSPHKWHQAEALRQAVNAPIQGAASDYTLFASIILREMRLKGELPAYMIQRMIIHDAVDYYVLPADVNWIAPIVTEVMANPKTQEWFSFQMKKVNMKVSIEVGSNWGNIADYSPKIDWDKIVEDRHLLAS